MNSTSAPAIISVVGKSNSGKTTFIEKLIPELKRRGYKVGVIKHAFHEFTMDKPGKDSWRHRNAGADTVIVASLGNIGMVKSVDSDSLDDLIGFFHDMDIVITEGYKRADKPKIEIFRTSAHSEPLCIHHPDLIAMVTDSQISIDVPKFGLDDVQGLADFIENRYLQKAN